MSPVRWFKMENSYDLDEEEIGILRQKVEGKTGRQIASELNISEALLSKKISIICGKLGVRTKPVAVRKAARELFGTTTQPLFSLNEGEKAVIRLLFKDFSTKEIGRELQIEPRLVDGRLYSACAKYNATSRDHLAAMITDAEIS